MRSLTSTLALGYALLACPAHLVAQAQAPRTVSFDTRYALQSYSNDAFGRLGIELLDLAVTPAEAITVGGTGGDLMRGILVLTTTGLLSRAYKLSYHEYGHGTRAAATGYRPYFGYGGAPTDVDEALASGELRTSFFTYFLGSFFQGGGFTYLREDEQLFTPLSDEELETSGWELIWAAGGINNEMYISQQLEERIRRGGAHVGMLSSWVFSKINPDRYGNAHRIGDVDAALDWYATQGYKMARWDLRQTSVVSLLGSASTYELIYRTARMIILGEPIRYQAWAPYGIELPNVGFFMTSAGFSYRIGAGYRRGRWRVPVAVEHVYNGDERTEVTVGGEWGPEPYYFALRATIGERLGGAVSVDRRIGDRFLVSGGYALYDNRNLFGERMIPSLESGPRYHDVFLRFGVVY